MKAISRRGMLLPASLFMAGVLSGATCSWDGALGLRPSKDVRNTAHAEASSQPATVSKTGGVVLPSGQSVADVAEKVTPSVVSVSSERSPRQLMGPGGHPFFSDPFFQFFFHGPGLPDPGEGRLPSEKGLGSGVIVSSDGVIVTNNHVIEGADKIGVSLKDGRELDAEVVGADPKSDLAVLRVKAKDLPAIPMADSSKLRTGDFVLAVGNPFGLQQTVTMGIVSAVGRANMGITDYEDFIQTDAAINPGNSGGALVTIDGRLAGINTAIASRTGGYQGIGFAIPSNMAVQIKDAILREGRVVRGWLGVAIQDLSKDLAKAMEIQAEDGVLVSDVSANSPAAKAGLKRGDVVVSMNGEKITDSTRLRHLVAAAGKGKEVTLEVLRQGKKQSIKVQLGEQPDDEVPSPLRPQGGKEFGALEGLSLRDLDPIARRQADIPAEVQGVLVTAVDPGSKAASMGLREGDVIVEANRTPTPNLKALQGAVRKDDERALLLVYRDGSTVYMLLSR